MVKLLDLAQRSGSGQTTLPVGKMVMKHFWVAYWRQYLGASLSWWAAMRRICWNAPYAWGSPGQHLFSSAQGVKSFVMRALPFNNISKSLARWQPYVRCPLYKCQHPQGPRGVRGVQTQRDDLPPVPGAPRQHQVEAGVRYLAWNLRSAVIRFWCLLTVVYGTGASAELVVRLL